MALARGASAFVLLLLCCPYTNSGAGVIKLAMLQMDGGTGVAKDRLSKCVTFVGRAARGGAGLAVTPAGWLTDADPTIAVEVLQRTARAHGIAIAVAGTRNGTSALHLIDPSGRVVIRYVKPGSIVGRPFPGKPVAPVRLTLQGTSVVVGGLLGADLLFPEPARLLMLGGAELVVAPVRNDFRGPLRPDALALLSLSRARENSLAVATTTRSDHAAGTVSSLFFPAGFPPAPPGPAAGVEGIAYASVNMSAIQRNRRGTTSGDNYRRPYDYLPLCFADARERNVSSLLVPPPEAAATAPLVVALLQMTPNTTFRPTANQTAELVVKADQFIRKASASGADVALLPELWSVGYEALFPCETSTTGDGNVCDRTDELLRWMRLATPLSGGFVAHYRALAKELGIAIAATYMEKVTNSAGEPEPPRNSVALIDRHGEVVYNYAKLHTCQFSALEALHTGGRQVYVGTLDTAKGPVKVASIICFDREQMETARMAALNGAELLLTPNACGLDNSTLEHFATRAMENGLAVAMTNYADVPDWHDATNGRSVAYDYLGNPLVLAGGDEGIYTAKVNLAALRAYRATAFGAGLLAGVQQLNPELCDFPRRTEFSGYGALGRMSGVL